MADPSATGNSSHVDEVKPTASEDSQPAIGSSEQSFRSGPTPGAVPASVPVPPGSPQLGSGQPRPSSSGSNSFIPDFRSLSTAPLLDRPTSSSAWREKAGAFLSSSSLRIRDVASKASTSVAEAAGGASTRVKEQWQAMQPRVAEAASKAGASVKGTWETTKDNWTNKVAPRMEAGISTAAKAAADTGLKLKQGIIETTERVKSSSVGQRLGEMTKAGVERSQALLLKNDWRASSSADDATSPRSVFGAPLEVIATRGGPTDLPVPAVVVECCDYILNHGLATPYLFETEGDRDKVKAIMKSIDEGSSTSIPEGTDPLDVAQLLLVYFKCLPEPVLTYRLHPELTRGSTDVQRICRLLRTLPTPNLETLHRVLCLLHKVSLRSEENKMDAQSLAAEFAPVLLWKDPVSAKAASAADASDRPGGGQDGSAGSEAGHEGGAAPSVIVDVDGNIASTADVAEESDQPTQEQTALVECVMNLIEQHDSIFSHSLHGPVLLLSDVSM